VNSSPLRRKPSDQTNKTKTLNDPEAHDNETRLLKSLPRAHRLDLATVGHFTLTSDIAVDVRFGTATGTATLTAANGDMLFLDLEGYAVTPALIETVAIYTITGGTGRFEGATGSFTAHVWHEFAVNLGVAIDPYIGLFGGTISPPGSHKH
jgi:hypothetical protein